MRTPTKTKHTAPASYEEVREAVRDYKTIREDYRFDGSLFAAEPDKVARVKWVLDHRLSEVDRTLIILYCDCLSTRKLGKRLGISHSLVAKEIRRIRETILEEYNKIKDNEHLF